MDHTPTHSSANVSTPLSTLHSLNDYAEKVCDKLSRSFGIARPKRPHLLGCVPIGLEIEVPHSSYFPDLWKAWGLHDRRVNDLNPEELAAFGHELAILEAPLREKLELSVECGIPRGNDRYWEFALNPVLDLGLAWEQTELLTLAGLLPRARRQALQATLGNLALSPDAYYFARVLEALYVEPTRIISGARAASATIFTGWGAKALLEFSRKAQRILNSGPFEHSNCARFNCL